MQGHLLRTDIVNDAQAGSALPADCGAAGATQVLASTQLLTQLPTQGVSAPEALPEVYFMVSAATSNVCIMESADCTKPLGLKVPLQRLHPASCHETAQTVTRRLLSSLRVRSCTFRACRAQRSVFGHVSK